MAKTVKNQASKPSKPAPLIRPELMKRKKSLIDQVIERFNFRVRKNIGDWQKALAAAENALMPRRLEYINLCDQLEIDNHVAGVIQHSRKNNEWVTVITGFSKHRIRVKQFAYISLHLKLWGKVGTQLHLIDAFVRQCSVSTMVKWFYDLNERIPESAVCEFWMEANFIQDLLLDEFTAEGEIRNYQLSIRGDKRSKPDKFSRIESTSPLYERGFIHYNVKKKDDPDFHRAIEQLLAIEQGSKSPDDSPDADEGIRSFKS